MPQLFQSSRFPLSIGGQIAQALADAPGLGESIGGAFADFKRGQLLKKKLSEIGADDTTAQIAGAVSPPMAMGAIGPTAPSQMTVQQLLNRRSVLGDTATSPSLAMLLGPEGVKGLSPAAAPFANLPINVAEKMGPFLRAGGTAAPQIFINTAALEAFHGGKGELPAPQSSAALDGSTTPMDLRTYRALQQNANYKRISALDATADDRDEIQRALNDDRVTMDQISSAATRPNGTKLFAEVLRKSPTKDFRQQSIDFKAETREATAGAGKRGATAVTLGMTSGTMEKLAESIKPLLANLELSDLKAVNSALRKGAVALNDGSGVELMELLNSLAAQSAANRKIAGGGSGSPTQKELEVARESIGKGLTEGGFDGLMKAISIEAKARTEALRATGGKAAPKPTAPAGRVVVEKGGKQFHLPQAQLKQAIAQGYREVK